MLSSGTCCTSGRSEPPLLTWNEFLPSFSQGICRVSSSLQGAAAGVHAMGGLPPRSQPITVGRTLAQAGGRAGTQTAAAGPHQSTTPMLNTSLFAVARSPRSTSGACSRGRGGPLGYPGSPGRQQQQEPAVASTAWLVQRLNVVSPGPAAWPCLWRCRSHDSMPSTVSSLRAPASVG